MENLKISVIIPVYNTSEFLPKSISSIINQNYLNLEIIIVNDGSTDSSSEIIASFANQDNRIISINKTNGGLQSARTAGIEVATGDFICFVDSDDSLSNHTVISDMCQPIGDNTVIVAGRVNIEKENKLKLFGSDVFDKIDTQTYLTKYLLRGRVGWNLCNKLFRSDIIKSIPNAPISVSAGEDALYTISLVSSVHGEVCMVNLAVYNYLVRSGSITQSRNPKYIYDNFKVADYIEKLLTDKVDKRYLVGFRLLCMSASFRYGWLGSKHPLNQKAIELYKKNSGVLPLFTFSKRVKIWLLVNFGDLISKFVFKNYIKDGEI